MATVKYLDKNGLSTVWSKVKGIVTPKADKVSGATAGHLAGLNSSGNLTDSGLAATNIAQKDGSYSGMTVGAAEDLVSAESVASEFTSRITGGSTAVGKGGTALVDKIKGRTLVWNQLNNFISYTDGSVQNVTRTLTGASNKVLTVTVGSGGPTTGNSINLVDGTLVFTPGHIYFFSVDTDFTLSTATLRYGPSNQAWFTENKKIWQWPSNAPVAGAFAVRYETTAAAGTYTLRNIMLIDLTLLFGAGSEPATPEEFEALYPGTFYDYNQGTLISNAAKAIETVGWNLYDPATGKARVIGGKQYHVGGTYTSLSKDGATITPDASGLFTPDTSGEVTVAGGTSTDTIISLSDPSRNGTYEPYWRSELELGLGDIKVKSHNLWDEEWENGDIDSSGNNTVSSTKIRSKNYIHVVAGNNYYFKSSISLNVFLFDDNKNLLYAYNQGSGTYQYWQLNSIHAIPSGVAYLRFSTIGSSVSTYANDICINLSDPAFNGRYEPYGDGGVISITGGLKSAGTVYDEISGGKLIQRVGSVSLKTLTWSSITDNRFIARLAYSKYANNIQFVQNSKYTSSTTSAAYTNSPDKIIWIETATGVTDETCLRVRDTAANEITATFVEALDSGYRINYELANPIEYELAEAIPTAMRNDPYGTERRLPADTASTVLAPFRADITYSTNIKEAVQSMHQNFINVNSMQDFLAELGTLMGGTWTMRPADGKFDFTFTPNPSNE